MMISQLANWENLRVISNKAYDNPVPSRSSDASEGQTTKAYPLSERMKLVLWRRNSAMRSALHFFNREMKI